MRKISKYVWHDRRKVFFELDDNDYGLDAYEADVDVWVVHDPEVDYHCIDDLFINSVSRNGNDLPFQKQSDICDEVRDAILNELNSEM